MSHKGGIDMSEKDYEIGEKINEGKTKEVFRVKGSVSEVVLRNKDDITKFDDPTQTQKFKGKGKAATITSSRVFEILKKAGIPVAFKKQISDTDFVSEAAVPILLEVIIRRLLPPASSYLGRRPDIKMQHPGQLVRFPRLVYELFLKTSHGGQLKVNDKVLINGINHPYIEGETLDDPLILNPESTTEWKLFATKNPSWEPLSDLVISVDPRVILSRPHACVYGSTQDVLRAIEEITRKTFLVLESLDAMFGIQLADFKIEFGWNRNGELVVIDVLDLDSCRKYDPMGNDISKQLFRDGAGEAAVMSGYLYYAKVVEQFRIPKQALVLWRGSGSDDYPELPDYCLAAGLASPVPGVNTVKITCSGHKQTSRALRELNRLHTKYPEGGVILSIVGRSNGLGPTLAPKTTWPVISIPASAKSFPEDVWSNIRMPSNVPHGTILDPQNAVDFALNILSKTNPVVYMHRQYAIEQNLES